MSNPADHSFYFNPSDDPCPYCDTQMAGALNCPSCIREHPDRSECDHVPMKAALDDKIGCIRCGKWLDAQ